MSGKHILTNSAMDDDVPKKSSRIAPLVENNNLRGSVNSNQTLENDYT
jgi:hypothetical protein